MPQFMKRRRNTWYSNIAVPADLRIHYNNRSIIEKTLRTTDQNLAQARARRLKGNYDLQFQALRGQPGAQHILGRNIYKDNLGLVRDGGMIASGPLINSEEEGIELAYEISIDEIVAEAERRGYNRDNLPPDLEARADGLMDGREEYYEGEVAPRIEYEPTFKEIADTWLDDWKSKNGNKETNTVAQYESTIRLFESYHGPEPTRRITRRNAVAFFDDLATFDPNWGRSPKTKLRSFKDLKLLYAGKGHRLSQRTLNRHIKVLFRIWKFARQRELATGDNRFDDLTEKAKSQSYKPWDEDELEVLFGKPPKRGDLHEVMLVAIYSGMRINEIAALTWGDLKKAEGIIYFDITDAKTEAGKRQVPVHSELSWLIERTKGEPSERIWTGFNKEGPGKKPGEDASKLFGTFKRSKGFTGRTKGFHSFRKNVTRIMERAQVPLNEWQEIFGHEKAFTWKVYGDGITMSRKQEIIELIEFSSSQTSPHRSSTIKEPDSGHL
jgi:integrase